MRVAIFLFACLLSGCHNADSYQIQRETDAKLAALETRVLELEIQSHAAKSRIDEMQASLESVGQLSQRSAQTDSNSGSWIMWQSQVSGPPGVLVPRREPQPMLAYSSQQDCQSDIESNIKSLNGDGSVFTDPNGSVQRLSCLPKGVDPR